MVLEGTIEIFAIHTRIKQTFIDFIKVMDEFNVICAVTRTAKWLTDIWFLLWLTGMDENPCESMKRNSRGKGAYRRFLALCIEDYAKSDDSTYSSRMLVLKLVSNNNSGRFFRKRLSSRSEVQSFNTSCPKKLISNILESSAFYMTKKCIVFI